MQEIRIHTIPLRQPTADIEFRTASIGTIITTRNSPR
jgi:hypothetical protein